MGSVVRRGRTWAERGEVERGFSGDGEEGEDEQRERVWVVRERKGETGLQVSGRSD